jgi:hypothetical protein
MFYRLIPREDLYGLTLRIATPGKKDKYYTVRVEEAGTGVVIKSIQTDLVSNRETSLGNTATDVFLFFQGALKKNIEYIIVADYGIPNAFFDLKTNGQDCLVVHNKFNNYTFDKVTIIFFCPPEMQVILKHYEDAADKKEGYKMVKGNEVSDVEVIREYDKYRKDPDTKARVWQYNERLSNNQSVGVMVVDNGRSNSLD